MNETATALAAPSAVLRPRHVSASRRSAVLLMTAAAHLAAAPYLYEMIRLMATSEPRLYPFGDIALEELAARDVVHGHVLLGPYSRFGWHHPGPALFYALALPVRVVGRDGVGVFVGVVLIAAVMAVAAVVIVGRTLGPLFAVLTAALLGLLHLCVGAELLRQAWNPFVIILPTVLFVILVAQTAVGNTSALAWALVVGSFDVQTHISTGPVVVAMLVVGIAAWVWHRRRDLVEFSALVIAGLAVFVLMWVPPAIDAVDHRPCNLTLLWRFFTAHHPSHTLAQATKATLAGATVVPFGVGIKANGFLIRSNGLLVVAGLVFAGLAIAAFVVGRRRGNSFGPWLAVITSVGLVAAIVGNTRVVGDLFAYLVIWQGFVPITLLLALACSLFGPGREAVALKPRRRPEPRMLPAGAVMALGLVAALVTNGFALRQEEVLVKPVHDLTANLLDVRTATLIVEANLAPGEHSIRLVIDTEKAWPLVAGVALALDWDGRASTVEDPWNQFFGKYRTATGTEDAVMEFSTDPQPQPHEAKAKIGQAAGVAIFTQRRP